jgi:hypothetical protein
MRRRAFFFGFLLIEKTAGSLALGVRAYCDTADTRDVESLPTNTNEIGNFGSRGLVVQMALIRPSC